MNFPKPVMSTAELKKMGFPYRTLLAIMREKGQNIAFQFNKNGTIYWDTEKLKSKIEKSAVRKR